MEYNSPAQNEQQLKNFDLSEYRQVIFSTIIVTHQQIIQQIQEIIKGHIVPAILDYDEMARGKQKGTDDPDNYRPKASNFLVRICTSDQSCWLVLVLVFGEFKLNSIFLLISQANVCQACFMSLDRWLTSWTTSMSNSRYSVWMAFSSIKSSSNSFIISAPSHSTI